MIINKRFCAKIIFTSFCLFSALLIRLEAVELTILSETTSELTLRVEIDADLEWRQIENYPNKVSSLTLGDAYQSHLSQTLEIPYYQWLIALPTEDKPSVSITKSVFESVKLLKYLTMDELMALDKFPLVAIAETGFLRDVPFGSLVIYPLRSANNSNELRLLREIEITIQYPAVRKTTINQTAVEKGDYLNAFVNGSSATRWRQSRPLSLRKPLSQPSGKWFRITVKKDGVYTLTLDDLKSAGLTETSIDTGRIYLYSNSTGGRPLDATIGAAVPSNLIENTRWIKGNNDQDFTNADTILFYGRATSGIDLDSKNSLTFVRNPYSLINYYWLFIADEPGYPKAMPTINSLSATPNMTVTQSEHLEVHEEEKVNFLRSGLKWSGEKFNTSGSNVSVILTMPKVRDSYVGVMTICTRGAVDEISHYFKAYLNNSTTPVASWSATNYQSATTSFSTTLSANINILKINYTSRPSSASAYLDYVMFRYTKDLSAFTEPQTFWSPSYSGIVEYEINDLNFTNPLILDVSDWSNVSIQQYNRNSNLIAFRTASQSNQRRQYYFTAPSFFYKPEKIELIPNPQWITLRNITSSYDYIIITADDFLTAAEKIATLYSQELPPGDRLNTLVVTQNQILREFNADITDPHAIRFFLKYAYENWTTAPAYVMLLGDGTFDYRAIESSTGNYVMTYQVEPAVEDYSGFSSYASDARFVYIKGSDQVMDMAIGRVPVRTATEALDYYEKLRQYLTEPIYGEWRSRITLVADDPQRPYNNEKYHINDTESYIAKYIPKSLITDKLYLLEYPEVQDVSSNWVKKPAATEAILNQLKRGTTLINYLGHGSSTVWAQEEVLKMDRDIGLIEAGMKLPLWIAGTCSWGQFDDINTICMPEALINKNSDGAIAILTPTRPTTGTQNASFIGNFIKKMFPSGEISRTRLGALIQNIYNGTNENQEKYVLFGDPALYLALPYQKATFDKMPRDTLAALEKVSVTGRAVSEQNFNGDGIINVFDSDRYVTRYYLDDAKVTQNLSYTLSGETLYRGNLKIENSEFSSRFYIPKDLSYMNLFGRIKVYGWNTSAMSDFAGCYDSLLFTGTTQFDDTSGPQIVIGFEGMDFKSGDIVAPDAKIKVSIMDPVGINIAGKLGHDITFRFDNDNDLIFEMTEDFVYDVNSDSSGVITSDLPNLSPGIHQITVKAWDNANNYATATAEFILASSDKLKLERVVNFPNPFASTTDFVFYLTQPGQVKITIYTIRGLKIKTILSDEILPPGFHQVNWDGCDDFGDEIARGIYLYKVQVQSSDSNQKDTFIGKMVKS